MDRSVTIGSMSDVSPLAESGGAGEIDAVRAEAHAAAMYVVHLRRELEGCHVELQAARAEIAGLRARLVDAGGLPIPGRPGLQTGLGISVVRVFQSVSRRRRSRRAR